MELAIELAEKGLVPDFALRAGIRQLLKQRLKSERQKPASKRFDQGPLAIQTAAANEQHYEVPAAFFQHVLGPRLKYSCCLYEKSTDTLAAAEENMLRLSCERAGIGDGMDILDLGCGWGALSVWMAQQYPRARITSVSNSRSQAGYIRAQCARQRLANVEVITADVNQFRPSQRYDRILSVEMFEHVRNYGMLLSRIHDWLAPEGALFVHIFCHRSLAYTFEVHGAGDWMARHFFSGGTMPSWDLLCEYDEHLQVSERWQVNGMHYAHTCRDWLENLDRNREAAQLRLHAGGGSARAARQLQRWRMFFLACEELFQYGGGDIWHVGHYLLKRREDL